MGIKELTNGLQIKTVLNASFENGFIIFSQITVALLTKISGYYWFEDLCIDHIILTGRRMTNLVSNFECLFWFTIWHFRLWSFQGRDTKLERFLAKNQLYSNEITNFENWSNGELSKSTNIWLSKSIFYVKNHQNLSEFFFHWRISIKEHICCYWHFLIKSIFKAVYY